MADGGVSILSPVCAYVAERTGSSLSGLQVGRLRDVLTRRLAGKSEEEYLRHLRSTRGAADLAELVSAIAVHKTDLFRDETQLGAFRQYVLTPLVRLRGGPIRLWSAGCATGEEVATLLIFLAEAGAHPESSVLGSDISANALRQAEKLSFEPETMRRVTAELRERYFVPDGKRFRLKDELGARARFVQHNLMDKPYPRPAGGGSFDVIFCRNVLIYFTDMAFDQVVSQLADQLADGGTLVLSSAEPILRHQPALTTLQCAQAFFYGKGDNRGRAVRLDAHHTSAKTSLPPRAPTPLITPLVTPAGLSIEPPRAVPPESPELDPAVEAMELFHLVLDWAAAGDAEGQTEQGLRKCLFLDPHLAQARYLLGMLLEQRGARAEAAGEYRRALSALVDGKARPTSFFLNNDRLKTACAAAVKRTGFARP